MKKLIPIIQFILITQLAWAQQFPGVSYQNITYQTQHETHTATLLFVNTLDIETPMLNYTTVFLLDSQTGNHLLTPPDSIWFGAYQFSVSPNSRYLSITYVAEGHPWIEIIDLQTFVTQQKYKQIANINPYPGVLYDAKWKTEYTIEIEADINLTKLNTTKSPNLEDIQDPEKYLYNLQTKKYSPLK